MKPIIKIENLSKRYKLGTRSAHYAMLRETFYQIARSPLKVISRGKQNESDSFWALRNVSFEVEPGEGCLVNAEWRLLNSDNFR